MNHVYDIKNSWTCPKICLLNFSNLIIVFFYRSTLEMATKVTPLSDLLKEAVKSFEETFGKKPEIAACAPGEDSTLFN